MAKSTLTPMAPTLEEFGHWLRSQQPGHGSVEATVLHHTWSPTAAQFRGRETIVGIRRFHMETRGFSDVAANAYACPDGTVITGRPLSASNWAHALISRGNVEAEARALAGGDKQFFNHYGFGLETVANFDEEPIHSGPSGVSYETALRVMTIVHTVYNLPASRLILHRDVADKSCPGAHVHRADFRAELERRLRGVTTPDYSPGNVVVKINDAPFLGWFDGTDTWLCLSSTGVLPQQVKLRPLAEASGCVPPAGKIVPHFEESPRTVYVYGPLAPPAEAIPWKRK